MKTEQEQIEAATMAIAREVCPYYNKGRCDLGSPTCHKTSIQLCSRKEAIIDSLNRIVKQAKIGVLNKVKTLIFQKDNPYNVPFEEFISANVFCGYIDELIKEVQNEN